MHFVCTLAMTSRVRLVDSIILILSVAATGLHVISLVFPGWWYIEDPDKTGSSDVKYFGIWVTVTCQNDTCLTSESDRSGRRAWLQGVAVMETLAAILLILNVLTQGVVLYQRKQVSLLRRLVVMLTMGAGCVILVGVLLFVKKKAGLTPLQALETRDGATGWPLFLSSGGASISIIIAIMMGVGQLTIFSEVKEYDEEGNSVSSSQNKTHQLNEIS